MRGDHEQQAGMYSYISPEQEVPADHLLRAWKQTSSGRTCFLYGGVLPVVELNNKGVLTSTNSFGATGLISRRTGSSMFYVFDAEGSVSQRTDSSGNISSNHLLNGFGEELSGSLTDPFGYRAQFGYLTDNETGLQLLTHRYYDPSRGRFLTRDPIGYEGGINLYAYSRNNPTNLIDPSRLDILVIEQRRTEGNPLGHTALAITGRGVFSFGNGAEMATDSKGNIMGGDLSAYLYRETGRRDTFLFIIKTTPEQDAEIEKKLREIAAKGPTLIKEIIHEDNCSIRSNRALDAGGIPNKSWLGGRQVPLLPGAAGQRALMLGDKGTHIPQGAKWQPTLIKDFMLKK